MQRYWVSWWTKHYSDDECMNLPFVAWVTGYRPDRSGDFSSDKGSMCAVIDANSPEEIWGYIAKRFPDYEQRFCEPKGDEFTPSDRFPGFDGTKTRLVVSELPPEERPEPCISRHQWVSDNETGGYCEECLVEYQVTPFEATFEAIKKRRQKIAATWQEIITDIGTVEVIDSADKHLVLFTGDLESTDSRDHAESDFIANAPTDVTWLINEIERLKLELERQYRHAQYARRTSSDLDDM